MSDSADFNFLDDSYKYQALNISGSKFLIGVCKKNGSRNIILTNLKDFYEENISKETIVSRCQDLNPAFEEYNVEEIVDNLLLDIPKYATTCSLDQIELESKIDDARFWFHINLKKCNPQKFNESLLEIFFTSFYELYNRYNQLTNIVNQKDREIEEYKAEGIKLLRSSMITEKFSKEVFETKLKNDKPLDKINVFLEVMNYNKTAKQIAKLEVQDVEKKDIEPKVTTKNCSKRKSSCVLRCAVPPTKLSRASNIQNTKKAEFQL
ncbi:uncharacterized protein LOC106651877 [Trichogramma pretiosum]|uniref:uncharacterized protein LOC106651877 n=1 Tax=Trichogramma pretiosum TaxID=7493 RepID=UPI0006C98E40|nr:uncharacterized protein LOC106651877 [Trichogramma pretiosum]